MRQEERRFPRMPIYLEVEAKHSDWPLLKARGFDISEGGICLFLSERLSKGEVMELEINLPPTVIAHGEVIWTQEVETMIRKFFQTGIRLINMESAGKAKIENFVRLYRRISTDILLPRKKNSRDRWFSIDFRFKL